MSVPYPVTITIFSKTTKDERTQIEFSPKLSLQRYITVYQVIKDFHERTKVEVITEFGCGNCVFLLFHMLKLNFPKIMNQIDVDENRMYASAHIFEYRRVNEMPPAGRAKKQPLTINLFKGNVAESDSRCLNTDVVVCIEMIEHLFKEDFQRFPETVFGYIKPKLVIITTPNYDFNVLFNDGGKFRNEDHKFEFTRKEFENWADQVIKRYSDYSVKFYGIGEPPEDDAETGFCTQMAIFEKKVQKKKKDSVRVPATKNEYSLLESYTFYAFDY